MSQNITICIRWITNNKNLIKQILLIKHRQTWNIFTLTVFFANFSRALPCDLKILTLALSKSLRSMPSLRGIAPTNKATSTSLKAVSSLSVGMTPIIKS
jgi:hypothetical protein